MLSETWRNPNAQPIRFRKVLAVAMVADPDLRKRAEDEIVSHLMRSEDALPARAVIPDAELGDVERARQRLRAGGFDGAVVIRPLALEEKVTYHPAYYGVPYDSFWGYYGYAWPLAYDAGYTRVDQILRVETLVYSVERDELVWTGVTSALNPGSLREIIDDIAQAVGQELRREGLVPPLPE